MASDGGVWVKLEDAGSSVPGAAVIDDAASNYDSKDAGVEIDGKTYDIYTFTTATTTQSVRLTDEAQSRITDEDLLMAVATTPIPDDFTGDPATLFDKKYRNQLRNAFEITPAVDPGLTLDVDAPGLVDCLIIGGGGGGGKGFGAGGGAGAVVSLASAYLASDSHTIIVGSGGSGSSDIIDPGVNGGTSAVGSYLAPGGGGGSSQSNGISQNGIAGGSGGGGSIAGIGGGGTSGFGFAGGNGTAGNAVAGGGGGAGAVGANSTSTTGGNGGPGVDESLFVGSLAGSLVLAGGGGGGADSPKISAGSGGSGGGGAGSKSSSVGTAGTANTGGGGGGGGRTTNSSGDGGNGGSGIVIVRVEI